MARWQDYVLRGTRADQPDPSVLAAGTVYCVTDEGRILERVSDDGTTWESYSPSGTSTVSVDPNGALLGDGSVPDPLAVSVDNLTIGINSYNELEVLTSAAPAIPFIQNFRLTLASGNPVYAPLPATPASTDTGAETVTFSSSTGWVSGTIVTVATTGGNLTAGTLYYLHAVTGSTVFSFHTTVADALSGASPVNLSASITAKIIPYGISNTTIYATPCGNGAQWSIYNGSEWETFTDTEKSLAIGTLSANTNYPVFVYNNAGVRTLELGSAWSADSVIAQIPPDCTFLNGVPVKTSDNKRRLIAILRTNSTTTTVDSIFDRFISNWDNQRQGQLFYQELNGTSFTYTVATWQQWRASTTYEIHAVFARPDSLAFISALALANGSNSGSAGAIGVGYDSVAPTVIAVTNFGLTIGRTQGDQPKMIESTLNITPALGYHRFTMCQVGNGSGTVTWATDLTELASQRVGIRGIIWY